jgi:hypothetical protein
MITTVNPGLRKARSRADKVPDPRQKNVEAAVLKRIRSKLVHTSKTVLPLLLVRITRRGVEVA